MLDNDLTCLHSTSCTLAICSSLPARDVSSTNLSPTFTNVSHLYSCQIRLTKRKLDNSFCDQNVGLFWFCDLLLFSGKLCCGTFLLKEWTLEQWGIELYRRQNGSFRRPALSVSRMLPSKLKCPLLPVNVYRFGVPQVDNDEETEAENRKRQNNTVLHCRNFWQSSASRENFWGSCEKLSRVLSKTFEGLVEFIWAPSLDFAPLPFNQVFLPLLLAVFKYHL